jgi:hypothetical protein
MQESIFRLRSGHEVLGSLALGLQQVKLRRSPVIIGQFFIGES